MLGRSCQAGREWWSEIAIEKQKLALTSPLFFQDTFDIEKMILHCRNVRTSPLCTANSHLIDVAHAPCVL